MPRSPSPPQRYPPVRRGDGGGYDRYRSPSPPRRYQDDRSRPPFQDRPFRRGPRPHERDRDGFDRNANRTWGNYRSSSGRGPMMRGDDGYGDRSVRDRSPYRGRSRSRDRDPGPSRTRDPDGGQQSRRPSPEGSRPSGSITPEEGQITSPAVVRRVASPPPLREYAPRRSVSPAYRRYGRDAGDRDRFGGWRRDEPRQRGGYGQAPRNRDGPLYGSRDGGYQRDNRPYRSPRRSRSRSTASSYTHSRLSSPVKREHSPLRSDRGHSPLRPRADSVDRKPSMVIQMTAPPPAAAPPQQPPVDRKPFLNRLPPSGPRSDRLPPPGTIPTGPRAHNAPPVHVPAGPRDRANSSSWSSVPPQATAPPPPPTPPFSTTEIPPSSPVAARSPAQAFGTSAFATPAGARSAGVQPTPQSPVAETKPQVSELVVKEYVKQEPISPERDARLQQQVKVEPVEDPRPDIKPVEPFMAERKPPGEEELREIKAKEIQARIMAELPPVRIPYGGVKWEVDLSHHWAFATTLQHQTLRAQSAARVAAAFLADAEAERLAASERRQVADAHLAASSLGVGSIMAVPGL